MSDKGDLTRLYEKWRKEAEPLEFYIGDPHAGRVIHLLDHINLLTAAFEPAWISVKDRLPDEETSHVLLRVDRVDEQSTWDIGLYEHVDKRWIHRLSQRYSCTVTHWMPLPEPPK